MFVTWKGLAGAARLHANLPASPLGLLPVRPRPKSVSFLFVLATGFLAQALIPVSAQIQVTESATPLQISLERIVELGEADGPGAIGRANELDQRSNGEWILTDNVTPGEVKFFSESGAWVRTIGRQGSGPGEYTYAWFIHPFQWITGNGILKVQKIEEVNPG